MAQAGQINARGDKLTYDRKNRMWVVTPSPRTQQMIQAADAAQLAQTEHDIPLARQEALREMVARGTASQAADAALTRYQDYNPMTPERLQDDLYTQAARGLKEGYGQTASDVSTQALRAGTGGGQLLDQLSRSYARDLDSARVDARVKALTTASDLNTANRGALLSDTAKLRSLASGIPSAAVSPDTLSANLSSILNSQRGGAIQGVYGLGQDQNQAYSNLIGQNENYYQDLGMSGGDIAKGLSALYGDFTNPSTSGNTISPTITKTASNQIEGF
jgi:hypothetical protein